ncbi:MAG TPA: hypothetical protein PLP17_06305, partial [Oligoflexia bacterium]|nr:hypothetical protein [Oligoflexia bacterium]
MPSWLFYAASVLCGQGGKSAGRLATDAFDMPDHALKNSLAVLFSLAFTVLGLSGCFRYGLPEYFFGVKPLAAEQPAGRRAFSDAPPAEIRQSSVVIVTAQKSMLLPVKDKRLDVLGHQFLFGFIPLTRLFFEHGPSSAVLELAIDVFAQAGYAVHVADETVLAQVVEAADPALIIDLKLDEMSINAYDAFFFRILSVTGEFAFVCLEPAAHQTFNRFSCARQRFGRTEYRAHGYGPVLSRLAEKELRNSLRQALQQAT